MEAARNIEKPSTLVQRLVKEAKNEFGVDAEGKRIVSITTYLKEIRWAQEFCLFVLFENIQRHWLKASPAIKAMPIYQKKTKQLIKAMDKQVDDLMRYSNNNDHCFTENVCKHLPYYFNDYVNEGYSVSTVEQYRHMQEHGDDFQKLEFSIRNALLASKQDVNVDVFTHVLIVSALAQTSIDLINMLHKAQCEFGHTPPRLNLTQLTAVYNGTRQLINVLATDDLKEYDCEQVRMALKVLQMHLTPEDKNDKTNKEVFNHAENYANFVISKMLQSMRTTGTLPDPLLKQLCQYLTKEEMYSIVHELRKMRIALGEEDAVEMAKVVNRAKNTPTLDLLRLIILTGKREIKNIN